MRLSVLVPSYRRPADLDRCLGALSFQERMADETIVVVRVADEDTLQVTMAWQEKLHLTIVEVISPGQVHALNAGLARCTGEVVAITDDDAAPRPDWLARIEAHFSADKKLGGLGGRDWVHQNGRLETGQRRIVGKIHWFGRITGNHHLGIGPPREVDTLKGANCAFRLAAIGPIGFNKNLRGAGAQLHNDMAASLAIKRAGWRLIYDPEVAVDHYSAKRSSGSERGELRAEVAYDTAFNFTVAINEVSSPKKRFMTKLWANLVGTKDKPGCVSAIRLILTGEKSGFHLWLAAHSGRSAAQSLFRRSIKR